MGKPDWQSAARSAKLAQTNQVESVMIRPFSPQNHGQNYARSLALIATVMGLSSNVSLAQSDAPTAPPLDAAAFEAYVTGRTLTYALNGTVYGIEEYLPGRKVRWQFTQDQCQYGSWYPRGEEICFSYEANNEEHCWRFWREGERLAAKSSNNLGLQPLSEVAQSESGLNCPAPDVGV